MAAGQRRLDALLIPGPAGLGDALIREALEVLCATPAPHGAERAAAEALAGWGRRRLGGLEWGVTRLGTSGANVVVTLRGEGPPALLLASHLDTSLSGHPAEDEPVTGRADPPDPLRVEQGVASGPGLGVARGPVAAALAGLAAVADRLAGRRHRTVQLLLAGSGTHRSALPSVISGGSVRPSTGAGALAHLAAGPRPGAVLVAKCGPPSVLHSEPGACYLRLTVTGRSGAALAPGSAEPPGGAIVHAGEVLAAVARWRERFVGSRRGRADRMGAEVGIGSISGGRPDKPDLLPAGLDLRLYVVTVPGDDPAELAADLAASVQRELAGSALAACAVAVTTEALHPAAVTAADAAVVVAADRAWRRRLPDPPVEPVDWTGSSDAVIFRSAGIETVRVGPTAARDPGDSRRDQLSLAALVAFGALYADVAEELATA